MVTANSIYNEIVTDVMSHFNFPEFMSNSNTSSVSSSSTTESFDDVLTQFMINEVSDEELSESIEDAILSASTKYDIDPYLIKAVIRQESNFDTYAVSSAGAQGLMQLMPLTAASLGVTDSFDVDQNIDAGTNYLDQLLDRYDGNEELALAAYNAGPSNVDKYGDIPPFEETENYVSSVLSYKEKYILEQYQSNNTN